MSSVAAHAFGIAAGWRHGPLTLHWDLPLLLVAFAVLLVVLVGGLVLLHRRSRAD